MNDLSEIDINFKIETHINKPDIHFYNVLNAPFEVSGLIHDGTKFLRMPEDIARTVSKGVIALHTNTAGGRIRFKTNSLWNIQLQ